MAEVVNLLLTKLVPFLKFEAVPFLIKKYGDALREHDNLIAEVQEEIGYIRDEFEQMKAFLRVADSNEDKDPQLKAWVKQVREAAYDTMDVADQFIFLFELHKGNADGLIRSLFKLFTASSSSPYGGIKWELGRIKSKVNHAAESYRGYYHGTCSILDRATGLESRMDNERLWYESRSDALQLEEHEALGIERPKSELISWLLQEQPGLQVLSVVGMAGLGKTTLVKKAFDDAHMKKNFQSHAWVSVSKQFKIHELLKGLIEKMYREDNHPIPPSAESKDPSVLRTILNDFLRKRKYLIVLDDVWDIDTWRALRYAFPYAGTCSGVAIIQGQEVPGLTLKRSRTTGFLKKIRLYIDRLQKKFGLGVTAAHTFPPLDPAQGTCGRVIITTRNLDVATFASEECGGKVYHLSLMSKEESWTLFSNKVFHGQTSPSHLEQISKCLVEKCGGLPLAIVAVAGLFSGKDKSNVEIWEKVNRSLNAELHRDGKLLWLRNILSLSYYDLPHYLKLCFLYMGIYPKDYLIDHWTLIRLWLAEGFIESKQNMVAEEVAEDYLTELVNRSLIIVARTNVNCKKREYRIHSIWHDIITAMSLEQNLISVADAQQRYWPDKIRRLSIHTGFENWKELKGKVFRLRSLLLFGAKKSESNLSIILDLIENGPKLVKVLDMRYYSLDSVPDVILMQVQLKYLSFRGTKVIAIPKSIGDLQMLETLDLKDTYVKELPNEILKLQRLRHLLVYHRLKGHAYTAFHNHFGFKALQGLGSLSSLQKLCSIELNQDRNAQKILRDIGLLTQLKRINILRLRTEDGRELCSSLNRLKHICSLSIVARDEDETIDLETLSTPLQILRSLNLAGFLPKLPHWIPCLKNLAKLQLRFSKMWADPLEHLKDLPNLTYLSLEHAYQGNVLCFTEGGFPRLIVLWLVGLGEMNCVTIMEGVMPHLEEMHISDCAMLEALPCGVEYLSSLRQLELCDMSSDFISSCAKKCKVGIILNTDTCLRWPLHLKENYQCI